MTRALTTFVGFGAAALTLWFVPDIADTFASPAWGVAVVWAAAGLVGALFYQLGGGLRLRPNLPLLVLAAAPWTIVAAALVAVSSNDPVWLADRARDLFPDAWLTRWQPSAAAFAFGSGLLIGFGVLGPRRAKHVAPIDTPASAPQESEQPANTPPELVGTPGG